MSQGCWTMADIARRRQGRRSAWASLYAGGSPMAQMMTHSADSLVTDSAAAGSAWGIGVHINNGSICMHGGKAYEPILMTAQKHGLATGVVSTARITHATPASFYANVESRNDEETIAGQLLDRGVDLMLGGGSRFFSDELLAKHGDVVVVRDARGLASKSGTDGRLLGLFNSSHMSYEADRPESEPDLKTMSMTALENLAARDQGFVLQIESGRVDHGGHANDASANLFDQLAFDDAVEAVTNWARLRGDTLVIVTTDHGTGGPELTLYMDEGNEAFERLLGAKGTATAVAMEAGRGEDRVERMVRGFREKFGIELSDEEHGYLRTVLVQERRGAAFSGLDREGCVIGGVLANHWGVGWVSGNHTAEMVQATAIGPGRELLRPLMDNVDFYRVMMEALGLRAVS
ncbi:Alkaline phosphatase 4 precursor [Mucisphaera calidilacus]|uniref:Alkaline phosphatase 4 n=2 Tax=Mucisphaera calidilacus TaxID=2527982 RepID=A0A518BYK3_9BACT|nr:Alkaline phosphatase 4 precursor [Mucisphaera calidilacus]